MPVWCFDFTGRVRAIHKRSIEIEEQLTEIWTATSLDINALLGHWRTNYAKNPLRVHDLLFYSRFPTNSNINFSLNPRLFCITEVKATCEWVTDYFLEETKLVEEVEEIGHGPAYIDHVSQPAGPRFPWPAGNTYFNVISRVPGEDVGCIFQDLSDDQLETIRE